VRINELCFPSFCILSPRHFYLCQSIQSAAFLLLRLQITASGFRSIWAVRYPNI
jgi:hypothetical protein